MPIFRLQVLTPERTVISTEVEYVELPGTEAHSAFARACAADGPPVGIGVLEFGPLQGARRKMALGGGFIDVRDDQLTVLAKTAELAGEIDALRAREAKERAERRLAERRDELDFNRARLALQKALLRLKIAETE